MLNPFKLCVRILSDITATILDLVLASEPIGVNHPAIVREIPHFGLFPAFCENVPHFCFISKYKKSLKIAIMFTIRRHFVGNSSAKTAMIASPSYLIVIFIQKSLKNAMIFTVGAILFEKALRNVN